MILLLVAFVIVLVLVRAAMDAPCEMSHSRVVAS